MEEHAIRKLEESKIASLMEFLLRYKLTKAEKLQIINILPTCEVEFHLVHILQPNTLFTQFELLIRLWKSARRGLGWMR